MKTALSIFDKAKQTFGLTQEFSLAGYILPDGDMLDFAEGQPYQRTLDHRSINQCYDFKKEGDTYNLGMKMFMNEGAIRLNVHSGSAAFDLSKKPTFLQRERIRELVRAINSGYYKNPNYPEYPCLFIDLSDQDGYEKIHLAYGEDLQRIDAMQVLSDIEDGFLEMQEEYER